ncbi:MAG: HD domain-containing protein [Treponema sp.]|jgi:putative two-component system response regulator|nr:HD domain-containing protein [Treponema sp.]
MPGIDDDNVEEELEPLDLLEVEEDSAEEDVSSHFSSPANPFLTSIFPVLFIDKKLKILYANPACEGLFTGFFNLAGNYFIDVFGRAFEMEDIRKIRETILSGENGFSWKGESKVKSRDMTTVQTRVYLFPAELDSKSPGEFVVMFDDVTEENKRLLRSVFESLLEASKLKDNDTGKHIIRVNYYSRRLAEELYRSHNAKYNRIDADYIDSIGFLASMHDVGKIGTPDDILNKEGPLSDWEWTIMREHTINGGFILSTYPHPMAKDIALCHHERWDGSGYPYKLEEEMIPLAARIVTIADVYDALRMERSYKPALNHKLTRDKMMEERGTHFDPSLIDVFNGIAEDFNEIYENNKDEKK